MDINTNVTNFNSYFESYKSKFSELIQISEEGLLNSFRLFDIRFRLALSMQIRFDNSISYTNTESTRKTYNLIIKLNNLWFAYEALYKSSLEMSFLKNNPSLIDPFTNEKITELNLDPIVSEYGNYLNGSIYSSLLKTDFANYLQYLIDNTRGRTKLKLESFKRKTENNILPDFIDILSLIYGMRIMYVHIPYSAKSGVKRYKTKIEILKNSNDFLTLLILKVSVKIIEDKILDLNTLT